jgi:hypothetical protein
LDTFAIGNILNYAVVLPFRSLKGN